MIERKQTESIGNAPYIHIQEPGPIYGARLVDASPADVAVIENQYESFRNRVTSELRHDEAGIDTERVEGFLGKYGLRLHPFIAIPENEVPKLESILGEQVNDEGRILGAHFPGANVTYVIRDKEFEGANGTGITEATLVHEQSHANKTLLTLAYGKDEKGIYTHMMRSGFGVEDGTDEGSGTFYEEGFAALMAHKYVVEELGRPNGFSDWAGAQLISIGGQTFKMPRSYWFPTSKNNRFGAADTPAFAAYGMELLIAKDPSIFESMLEARHTTDGLREFAHKVESLDKGLYRLLGRQPYKVDHFIAATNYIIEKLYGGNQDEAIEAVAPVEVSTK